MRRSILAFLLSAPLSPLALANPTGPTVVSGAAALSNPNASTLQIVNTPGTIINWQGFSIGVGEITHFVQQNAASAVLNRVIGANPSSLLGRLDSNGRVFLINPNGIIFGSTAVIDVAGLIASTRDIADAEFLAGNYIFSGAGSGTISIESGAQILTSTYGPGGQVWLFAKDIVQQSGSSITTPQGQTVLAAGSQLVVTQPSLGNMNFNVITSGGTIQTLGSIAADRGAVGLFADSITHGGTISTPSTASEQGSVVAHATSHFTASANSQIHADGTNGSIEISAGGTLKVEPLASVTAAGTTGAGGTIGLTASDMRVFPLTTHAASLTGAAAGSVTVTQTQPSSYVAGNMVTTTFSGTDIVRLELQADGSLHFIKTKSDGSQTQVEIISADISSVSAGGTAPALYDPGTNMWFHFSSLAGGSLNLQFGGLVGPATQSIVVRNPDGSVRATSAFDISGKPDPQPMVGGGYVLGGTSHVGLFNSGGVLQGTQPVASPDYAYGTGLLDGGYAVTSFRLSPQAVTWYSQSGAPSGSALKANVFWLAPTATGFVTGAVVPGPAVEFTGYNKVTPAFTPLTTASSNVHAPAAVATIPGVALEGPAPAPTPVVQGSGSGASFDGVSGCNASVCSDEVRAALAQVDVYRAADNTGAGGRIEQGAAERAVAALFRAAGREADAVTASGIAVIMEDHGEVRRLVEGDRLATMSPEERLDALEAWLENETADQSLGQTGTGSSPNEISLVNAVSNMSQTEKQQFLDNLVANQRQGTDEALEIVEHKPSTPEEIEDALTAPGASATDGYQRAEDLMPIPPH